MYAIVKTGGKQYKVAKDEVISVEKLAGEPGDTVTLDVVFLNDGKKIVADPAKLAKAKVTAEIVEQYKGEKVIIFKFKKRKGYKKTQGHRQQLTKLRITNISAGTTRKAAAKKEEAPAEEAAAE
jgi:large subunit ribosomal protein L21